MANVTGIEISPILQRLNSTTSYHPFDAETFSDWATEAGDIVTISRNGENYVSPVHTSRMVWKGKAPTMQMSATGNEKRDAVARVSRKKYGRGSAGLRSNEQIHRNFTSEDGILHSELHITESYLRTEFVNEVGSLRGEFEITASGLRTEFNDMGNSLRGEFEVTASHLRTEFDDKANSLRGEFEVTASHLRTEFDDKANSLRGEFQVTASGLRTEFNDMGNSLRGEFQVTASGLRTEFNDMGNSLRGEFQVTASGLRTEFNDMGNSLRGEFQVTASGLRTEFNDMGNSLRGEFQVTASGLRTEFNDMGNSLRGEFQVTASGLRTEFESETGSLRTDFEVTSSGLNTRVSKVVDDNGNIKSARICVAINNDNSSQAVIEADKIHLLGQTILDTANADYIMTTIQNANQVNAQRVNANVITITPIEGGDAVGVQTGIKEVQIVGPTNNQYKLQFKRFNSTDWVDADPGTFSRATTLSAGWDGNRKFTVGATPQGNSRYTSIVSAVPQAQQTWNGTMGTLALKATIDDGETTVDVGDITVNVANFLQDKTGANKITENGTYTPDTGYIGFSQIEIDVAGGGGSTTTIGTSWTNSGVLTITASPQGVTEKRYLVAGATTWDTAGNIATVPIESKWGSSMQYSEGVVFSPTVDITSKITSAKNSASAAVTLLDPVANSKPNGQIDNNRTFTVSTTGRKNSSGSTENLDKSVPLHLYWDGSFSSNVATVYMKWGATPGSSGTNYAKVTVDAGTIVTNEGYAGRAAVTISDTLTWTTNPGENITVNQNAVTVKTIGRTDSSGNGGDANQSSKKLNFYSNVGSWGTPSANKCYVYVTYGDSANTSRVIRREVDATARYRAGMQAVNLGDYTVNAKTSGIDGNRTFTVSTTGRLNASGSADNISKDVPLHLYWDGTFSSNVATVYLQSGTSGSSGTNYAKLTVNASTLVTNAGRAGRAAVTLNDPTWNAITGATPENRTVTVSTTGRTNASGTTENLSKSIALYLTKGDWSSNKLTVFMRTVSTKGNVYAETEVDASSIYTNGRANGWGAFYNTLVWAVAKKNVDTDDSASMTEFHPSATVDSASDASARVYTLYNKSDNVVELRRNNTTTVMATITHNKYTAGYNAAKLLPTWDSNQANKLTISKTTSTSYGNTYTLYVFAGLTDYTYNSTTHQYSIQGIAKAGISVSGATERNRSDAKTTGTEAYDAGKVASTPDEVIYLSRDTSKNGSINVRCRRGGVKIVDRTVDITNFLNSGNLGMMAVSSAGSEHSQLGPGIYCIGGAGIYNTNKTWQVPNQNPTYSYSVTLTRYRAGAVEQILPGTLYRRLTNGTYQALGDSSTYWYACKRDLGSSKTVHYN